MKGSQSFEVHRLGKISKADQKGRRSIKKAERGSGPQKKLGGGGKTGFLLLYAGSRGKDLKNEKVQRAGKAMTHIIRAALGEVTGGKDMCLSGPGGKTWVARY